MSSLTVALEIAKNTLLNTQVQMGTASHNIANADNKAYARQKALLATNRPIETAAGFLGMGARVDQIIQQRDQFIERSLLGSISKESDYEARSATSCNGRGSIARRRRPGDFQCSGGILGLMGSTLPEPCGTIGKNRRHPNHQEPGLSHSRRSRRPCRYGKRSRDGSPERGQHGERPAFGDRLIQRRDPPE